RESMFLAAASGQPGVVLSLREPARPLPVRSPAARTTEVDLVPPAGLKTGFSVVVQPQRGSGPVYGGRVLQEPDPQGLMITVQPLAVARTSVLVPPAVDSPSVVVR